MIKGERVNVESSNGKLYEGKIININDFREPSMRVAVQLDCMEDVVFTSLESIKNLEEFK